MSHGQKLAFLQHDDLPYLHLYAGISVAAQEAGILQDVHASAAIAQLGLRVNIRSEPARLWTGAIRLGKLTAETFGRLPMRRVCRQRWSVALCSSWPLNTTAATRSQALFFIWPSIIGVSLASNCKGLPNLYLRSSG